MGWDDWSYQPKAPEELTAIAERAFKGEVFVSDLLPNKAWIPEVFKPVQIWLMGGAIDALTREHIDMIYAHRDMATGNNLEREGKKYPTFNQAHCLNEADATVVRQKLCEFCDRYERELAEGRAKLNKEAEDEEDGDGRQRSPSN